MPFSLLRLGLRGEGAFPLPPPLPLPLPLPGGGRKRRKVVVVGGGGHGLAAAYYLARDHGITDVAVLEKGYIGGGNTGRNTTIIRANYLTPEGVLFYKESLRLFEDLDRELGVNLMYSRRGHLTLAHTDAALRTARWRAGVNQFLGVDSRLVYPKEIARLCPQLNLSPGARYPILGALYHPPGAIARHDAVAWGYAKAARALGVEIYSDTAVTGVVVEGGEAKGVRTAGGVLEAEKVLQATAGLSSQTAAMAGLRLPITTVPLQACVSEPLKPFLDAIVVSGSLHTYVSQSARGELVMGGSADPAPLYSTRPTLEFKESLAANLLELFPFIGGVKVLRQWAGMADMTPDFSPVMGVTPVRNYFIDSGWGTWGFKATPAAGKYMAQCVASGEQPELLRPFALSRFGEFNLVGERGAASVGH